MPKIGTQESEIKDDQTNKYNLGVDVTRSLKILALPRRGWGGLTHCSHMQWGPKFVKMGTEWMTQFWVKWGPYVNLLRQKWGPRSVVWTYIISVNILTEISRFCEIKRKTVKHTLDSGATFGVHFWHQSATLGGAAAFTPGCKFSGCNFFAWV